MPRKPKWPPSILRHKPSGRDRIRVNGKEYWLGLSGSDEARAEYARLVTLLASPEQVKEIPPPAWTVAAAIAEWDRLESGRLTAKEAREYRRALTVVLRVCGRLDCAAFDSARLAEVRAAMVSGSWMNDKERAYFAKWNRPCDWSARVCNRQVVRVRTVWRWLERQKIAPRGASGELALLRGIDATDRRARHRPKTRPAALADIEATLAFVRAPAVRDMLLLQWWTGMRSGELRKMKAGEVDRSGEVWVYTPATHKNAWRGQERAIPIGPSGQKILGPRLDCRPSGAYVFTNRKGKPYSADGYGLIVRRAAKKAGLPWLRPYCARHGAKQRIVREMGLDAARAILGQASLGTTNAYAAGIDLDLAREAARRLG